MLNLELRKVGVISDTHGLLRPAAMRALEGCGLIVHAGDVGRVEILHELERIAPVVAVRGNVDTESWAHELPLTAVVQPGSVQIYLLHNLEDLDLNPAAAGFQVVVSGHSHKPARFEKAGVLYLNPGSAGPRRFDLPISVAHLDFRARPWKVDFIELEDRSPR